MIPRKKMRRALAPATSALGAATLLVVAAALAATAALATAAGTQSKPALTLDGAKQVAAAAAGEARRNGAGGAIAIVDDGGHLLYLERLDGTFPAGAEVAIEKARTAAIFRRPTLDFENAIKNGRTALVAVNAMTPLEGGVPIVVAGATVGAIGVSGAQNADQDEAIARAAAAALVTGAESAGR